MNNTIKLHYEIDGENFIGAGEASGNVKKMLKKLGADPEVIRRVAIAMYEGEINMVIHANGGTADIDITPEEVKVVLADRGPGIPDIAKAMQKGYSTATDTVRELGFGAGMGLPNIQSYTDDMKISTELGVGTTVEMTIRTNK